MAKSHFTCLFFLLCTMSATSIVYQAHLYVVKQVIFVAQMRIFDFFFYETLSHFDKPASANSTSILISLAQLQCSLFIHFGDACYL